MLRSLLRGIFYQYSLAMAYFQQSLPIICICILWHISIFCRRLVVCRDKVIVAVLEDHLVNGENNVRKVIDSGSYIDLMASAESEIVLPVVTVSSIIRTFFPLMNLPYSISSI